MGQRKELPEIEVGDLFFDKQGLERNYDGGYKPHRLYRVVYENPERILLRGNRVIQGGKIKYRNEIRESFEDEYRAGRYELVKEDLDIAPEAPEEEKEGTEIDLESVSGIGNKSANGLKEKEVTTDLDIIRAGKGELKSVRGIGEGTAENLLDRAKEVRDK